MCVGRKFKCYGALVKAIRVLNFKSKLLINMCYKLKLVIFKTFTFYRTSTIQWVDFIKNRPPKNQL
jgi:hypothetical protein